MIPVAQQHRLSNNLAVLTLEQKETPLVSFWLWYKVGSRNELPGSTGLSHWVEHMMFKGTPAFPGGTLDKLINESGGHWNAFTTTDCTAYYTTLPVERLKPLLLIERDRMQNTLFVPEEVENERSVILSERAGYENYPEYWLEEAVENTAYTIHPYRHEVLGERADIERNSRDELLHHYHTYYNPANALVVAVGGFDTTALLQLLDTTLGSLPPGEPAAPVHTVEPPQTGERTVTVRRPGPTPYLHLAYHIPPAGHPDRVALALIDAILTGGKPPSTWNAESEMGRSSRLYRLLVDNGLANDVHSEAHPTIDPGLFRVSITLRPEASLSQVEELVIQAVESLAQEPVPDDELIRARKQCKAQMAYTSAGVEDLALLIGTFAISDHTDYLYNLAVAIDNCTAGDIQRVARAYLHAQNRTCGRFIPTETEPEEQPEKDCAGEPAEELGVKNTDTDLDDTAEECALEKARQAAGLTHMQPLRLSLPLPGPKQITRAEIQPGVVCLASTAGSNIVTFLAAAAAGSAHENPAQAGLAHLVSDVILRGTQKRSTKELHNFTDALGMSISTTCSDERTVLEVTCLAEDAVKAAELLAELWLTPALNESEVTHVQGRQVAHICEREDDTQAVAERVWREATYKGHPFGRPTDGYVETVENLTPADCRDFHNRHYLQAPTILCASGAIAPQRALDILSNAWQRAGAHTRRSSLNLPTASLPLQQTVNQMPIAGKSQTDIVLGFPTLARTAADYPAFYLGHLILGRLGLYGRLGAHIRERLGLAYYVYSGLEPRTVSSPWAVRAGVQPHMVNKAVDAILGEIRTIMTAPIRDHELAEAVGYLIGSLPAAVETAGDLADVLLDLEFYGLGLDYLQTYVERVTAVTASAIQEAMARHLCVDNYVLAVAGLV